MLQFCYLFFFCHFFLLENAIYLYLLLRFVIKNNSSTKVNKMWFVRNYKVIIYLYLIHRVLNVLMTSVYRLVKHHSCMLTFIMFTAFIVILDKIYKNKKKMK